MSSSPKISDLEVLEDFSATARCDEGFLQIRRLRVHNRHADGTVSKVYRVDVVDRPRLDAVSVLVYRQAEGGGVEVLTRTNLRPAAYFRKDRAKTFEDEPVYLQTGGDRRRAARDRATGARRGCGGARSRRSARRRASRSLPRRSSCSGRGSSSRPGSSRRRSSPPASTSPASRTRSPRATGRRWRRARPCAGARSTSCSRSAARARSPTRRRRSRSGGGSPATARPQVGRAPQRFEPHPCLRVGCADSNLRSADARLAARAVSRFSSCSWRSAWCSARIAEGRARPLRGVQAAPVLQLVPARA